MQFNSTKNGTLPNDHAVVTIPLSDQMHFRTAVLDWSLLDVPNKVATGCMYVYSIYIKQGRQRPLTHMNSKARACDSYH